MGLMQEFGDNAPHQMDASGLYCPEPVMLLHNKIREVAVGDLIRMVATDPSTERDVAKFCHYLGHELLASEREENRYYYLIRKGLERGAS